MGEVECCGKCKHDGWEKVECCGKGGELWKRRIGFVVEVEYCGKDEQAVWEKWTGSVRKRRREVKYGS